MIGYKNLSLKRTTNKLLLRVLGLLAIFYLVYFAFNNLLGGRQQDAYVDMFTGDSRIRSMDQRFGMWAVVPEKAFEHPGEFLFGIGPNVNLRLSNLGADADNSVFSVNGEQVISFHNFFIDCVFQIGVVFGISMVVLFLSTLKNLLRRLKESAYHDELALDCAFGLLAFMLAGFTMGASWSKPYLVVAQLLAISHLLMTKRFHVHPAETYQTRIG
jgi:O-antigen ligase